MLRLRAALAAKALALAARAFLERDTVGFNDLSILFARAIDSGVQR